MTYFNKKEEVLDIELTQYGKHLLSIGKLSPTYYRFFDDDILYDGQYANIEETQNDIHPRITDATPNKKTQHNYIGLETQLKVDYDSKQKPYTVAEHKKIIMPPVVEKEYVLNDPLGTSNMGEDIAPNFNLGLLRGEIDSFSNQLISPYQALSIPQVDITLSQKLQVRNLNTVGIGNTDPELASPIFEDGTFIGVYPEHVLAIFTELGAPFRKENFNIEVYEVIDVSASVGTKLENELRQLSFATNPSPAIVNGILLDKEQIRKRPVDLTPDHVEYFFEILVDDEISEGTICENASRLKSLNISLDKEINCPDLPFTDAILDPYYSEIDQQKATVCKDDGGN
jgi:hypothetical protein